jgi:hypothetical protein
MNMRQIIGYAIAGGVFLFLAWFAFSSYLLGKLDGQGSATPNAATYESKELGVSFEYYKNLYEIKLQQSGNDERNWQTLVFLPKGYVPPEGGEGPATITISRFPNTEGHSLAAWIRGDARSNFKLSADQTLEERTVGGYPALGYTYSGLYESDAVAVSLGEYIYLFEVGHLTPQDRVRADFQDMITTVEFTTEE